MNQVETTNETTSDPPGIGNTETLEILTYAEQHILKA